MLEIVYKFWIFGIAHSNNWFTQIRDWINVPEMEIRFGGHHMSTIWLSHNDFVVIADFNDIHMVRWKSLHTTVKQNNITTTMKLQLRSENIHFNLVHVLPVWQCIDSQQTSTLLLFWLFFLFRISVLFPQTNSSFSLYFRFWPSFYCFAVRKTVQHCP